MSAEMTAAVERATGAVLIAPEIRDTQHIVEIALAAALDVQEMAKVIDPRAFGPITHGSNVSRYFRAQQAAGERAIAIRNLILGTTS